MAQAILARAILAQAISCSSSLLVRELSSRFFTVFASSFCIPGKPSHGTQGMEFSPDSRWVGPNHSRGPTQIREVAQFEASQQHSSNSPRWSQSRAVEGFSQCRHESPQYPGSSGGGRRCNVPKQCHSLRHDSPEVQTSQWWKLGNGAEVDAIKKALVKAKAAAHEKPLTEMIADCKGVIDRAEKRLEKLEAALLEGRARLARLEAQAAVAVPMPPATAPASELEAEVSRLREELASVRGVSSTNTSEETVSSQTLSRRQRCG